MAEGSVAGVCVTKTVRDRRVDARRRRAVAEIMRAYAGGGVVLVGRGRIVESVKHELNRAQARHLRLWLEDVVPAGGATVHELRDLTGAGKKALRRRLVELESLGRVRRDGGRWYPAEKC